MNIPNQTTQATDVFISYSRQDQDFVRHLHTALAERRRDTWVDWKDIAVSAEWLKEIYAGIEAAQNFIFVMSPDSVKSEICQEEIEHALKHNKRIVPILYRRVSDQEVPEPLRPINWISIQPSDDFTGKFHELVTALDTDLAWVKAHTRLLVRAIEWEEKKEDDSFLLRGKDLQEAEEWQAQAATGKEPKPTALQAKYIFASRKSANVRQRITLGAIAFALIVAVVLTLIALAQSNIAERARMDAELRRQEAETQQRISNARELASTAVANLNVDPERSILLAMRSIEVTPTFEGELALRQALSTSRLRLTLRGHTDRVKSAVFSPDGRQILTASWDGTARFWDAGTGQEIARLGDQNCKVQRSGVYSPDGKQVAVACWQDEARIWDASTRRELMVLRGHTDGVNSVAFSPNGKRLVTASMDKTARIWDATNGRQLLMLRGHTEPVNTAVFSPDGKQIVTSSQYPDGTTRIWDAETGKELSSWHSENSSYNVNSASFNSDGKLILSSLFNGTIHIWDRSASRDLVTLRSELRDVRFATFSNNGRLIAGAGGFPFDTTIVWNAVTYRELSSFRGHTDSVNMAAFSPNEKEVVTASDDQTAKVWSIADFTVAISDTRKLVRDGSEPNTIQLLDPVSGEKPIVLRGHSDTLHSSVFSADGKRLVTTSFDGTARIWNTSTGQNLLTLRGHNKPVTGAAFSPDGMRVATIGLDWTVRVWDAVTGNQLISIHDNTGLNSVAFSPDGQSIVTTNAMNNLAKIWQLDTGKESVSFSGHSGIVSGGIFSPDGKLVVTTSHDRTARIWDAATGREIAVLRGHTNYVNSATFSPDGKRLATEEGGGMIRFWDTSTWQELTQFVAVGAMDHFSEDGRFLRMRTSDGLVEYPLLTEDLLNYARTRVTRELWCAERQTYLHEAVVCPTPTPTSGK